MSLCLIIMWHICRLISLTWLDTSLRISTLTARYSLPLIFAGHRRAERPNTLIYHTFHFYRARRMHSADYAVARCLSVRPSVCPSDTRRYWVSTVIHILKVLSPSGSPTILVFSNQTGWQYSDEDPDNGSVECKGVWKNHDYRPIFRFISQMMQERTIVTMEGE